LDTQDARDSAIVDFRDAALSAAKTGRVVEVMMMMISLYCLFEEEEDDSLLVKAGNSGGGVAIYEFTQ
jgi:hypothetical protein